MSFSASAADERVLGVEFSGDALSVSLRDGRVITVPLAWYPRLLDATPKQLQNWKIAGGGYGLHWPDLDEDLSTEGLLRGAPAPRTFRLSLEPNFGLSDRERQVVPLIAQGLTNRDLARKLGISEQTVRSHIHRILRKVGAHDRFAIVELAPRLESSGRAPAK